MVVASASLRTFTEHFTCAQGGQMEYRMLI